MNNQPTQKDIDERLPIMKSDYLHLLYRVEELERTVARLTEVKGVTTTYGNVQAPGIIKSAKSLKEMLDEMPDGVVWGEAMCEYQPKDEDPFIEKFNKQQ